MQGSDVKRKMAALVFGNANYHKTGVLRNPANDAADMSSKLASYGFHVIVVPDATNTEMDKKLDDFRKLLETNEVGLFFFAGHGMQIDGCNYLLAVDTRVRSHLNAYRIKDLIQSSEAAMATPAA